MRVPGNERAFTVSPARGIPFPQLVCIGAAAGQSQAFPVSARARLAAAGSWNWPARPRRCRALLYAAWVESPRLPRPPRAPRALASTHTHAHTHTYARGPALVRTAALRLCARAASRCHRPGAAVRSGATGGRGPETREVEKEEAGRPWEGSGRAPRPERPGHGDRLEGGAPRALEMKRPPRGSRDRYRSPGAAPGPERPPRAKPLLPRRGWDSAARGAGGPRARPKSGSAGPHGRVGSCSEVTLIHLTRPDDSRSPQHGFVFLVFSLGLLSLIGVFHRVRAAA